MACLQFAKRHKRSPRHVHSAAATRHKRSLRHIQAALLSMLRYWMGVERSQEWTSKFYILFCRTATCYNAAFWRTLIHEKRSSATPAPCSQSDLTIVEKGSGPTTSPKVLAIEALASERLCDRDQNIFFQNRYTTLYVRDWYSLISRILETLKLARWYIKPGG